MSAGGEEIGGPLTALQKEDSWAGEGSTGSKAASGRFPDAGSTPARSTINHDWVAQEVGAVMAVVVVTAPTRDRARSAPSGRDGDGGLSPPPVTHITR